MAQQNKNNKQPTGFGGFDDLISDFSEDEIMPPKAKSVSHQPAAPTVSRPEPPRTPSPSPPRSNDPPKPTPAAKTNTTQDTQLIHLDDWIEMTAAESPKSPTQPQAPKPEKRVILEPKPDPSSLAKASEQGSQQFLWFSIACGIIFLILLSSGNDNQNQTSTGSSLNMTNRSAPVLTESKTTEKSKPEYNSETSEPIRYQETQIKQWVTRGKSYYWGEDNIKDYHQAFQWFKKAAYEGNAEAQVWLGILYSEGKGIPQDDTEAVRWYRKAADQGSAVAMFNLGLRCQEGRGVTQNNQLAIYWFKKSAALGFKDAKQALKEINRSTQKEKYEADPLVIEIQKKLLQLGYLTGKVDGHSGQKTLNAIKQFQQENSLLIDLEISEKLLSNLNLGEPRVSRQVRQNQVQNRQKSQSDIRNQNTNKSQDAANRNQDE